MSDTNLLAAQYGGADDDDAPSGAAPVAIVVPHADLIAGREPTVSDVMTTVHRLMQRLAEQDRKLDRQETALTRLRDQMSRQASALRALRQEVDGKLDRYDRH